MLGPPILSLQLSPLTALTATSFVRIKDQELKKQGRAGDFSGSPVVRNPCFLTARAPGSICGWGTKIPHAVQCGQENKKIKNKTGTCTPSCGSSSENQVSSQTQRPSTGPGARGVVQTSTRASHWVHMCMSTCLTFLDACRISLEGHAHPQLRVLGRGLVHQR